MLLLIAAISASVGAVEKAAAAPSPMSAFMRQNYPRGALQRGEQGTVGFEATVDPNGFMSGCKVTKSSGHQGLDRETCEFLVMHAKFPQVRTTDGMMVQAVHQGAINWRLPDSRPAAATRASPTGATLELICKRFPKTGSRTVYLRQCLTEAEWTLKEANVQDEIRRLQSPTGTIPSGPQCQPRC